MDEIGRDVQTEWLCCEVLINSREAIIGLFVVFLRTKNEYLFSIGFSDLKRTHFDLVFLKG